ncbi:MAG: cytochrome c-type biogenesis protein CcmH [Zetaproteobacteria bacterium]|nr:cytochrome c-type biogenesis protein CcmH [Zetaproteobacteria bacterium]
MKQCIFWLGLWVSVSTVVQAAPTEASLAVRVEQLSRAKQVLYQQLSDELRCPTCTGLSVLQSDAPFSLQIRATVLEQLEQGKSAAEIRDFFTSRYGLWILRSPPVEGIHLLAWFIPTVIAVVGALAVWIVFWRRRRSSMGERTRSREELVALMQQELEKRRRA